MNFNKAIITFIASANAIKIQSKAQSEFSWGDIQKWGENAWDDVQDWGEDAWSDIQDFGEDLQDFGEDVLEVAWNAT